MAKVSVLAACGLVLCTGQVGAEEALPAIECVEALRKARIVGEAGNVAEERKAVESAVDAPGCELPALFELLRMQHEGRYPAEQAAAVRQRLGERVEDPASRLPPGFIELLAGLAASTDERERLLAMLERRRIAVEAGGRPPVPAERAELVRIMARLQEELGRPEQARENVARLLALDSSAVARWWALELDLQLERWESAAGLLREMLPAEGAGDAHLEQLYLETLARLGRFEELMARLERYKSVEQGADVAMREWLADVCVGSAWALRDAGRDAEAEGLFRRAAALAPDHPSAHLVLLHLYTSAAERRTHEAAVAARRANEQDAQALFDEGTQLLAAGDAASAIDLLARAAPHLEGTNQSEAAWYNLGLAAYRLERWQEAAAAFRRAGDLNSGRAETFLHLGVALQRSDACSEAVVALRRALELAPDKPQAHYFLGRCYEVLGDPAAAARENEAYRRAKGGE